MRKYTIEFIKDGEVISSGITRGLDIRQTRRIAQYWKRHTPEVNKYSPKSVKTIVTLIKQ